MFVVGLALVALPPSTAQACHASDVGADCNGWWINSLVGPGGGWTLVSPSVPMTGTWAPGQTKYDYSFTATWQKLVSAGRWDTINRPQQGQTYLDCPAGYAVDPNNYKKCVKWVDPVYSYKNETITGKVYKPADCTPPPYVPCSVTVEVAGTWSDWATSPTNPLQEVRSQTITAMDSVNSALVCGSRVVTETRSKGCDNGQLINDAGECYTPEPTEYCSVEGVTISVPYGEEPPAGATLGACVLVEECLAPNTLVDGVCTPPVVTPEPPVIHYGCYGSFGNQLQPCCDSR